MSARSDNAIFLDMLDQDAEQMERLNGLIREVPAEHHSDLRVVKLLVVRPSRDLGLLASDFEPNLPATFRWLTRRLGTRRARTQDFLSTAMFEPEYLQLLIELGMHDGEARAEDVAALLET